MANIAAKWGNKKKEPTEVHVIDSQMTLVSNFKLETCSSGVTLLLVRKEAIRKDNFVIAKITCFSLIFPIFDVL